MKQITFGFALSGGCLRTSTAWTEPLPRVGVNDVVLYNIFAKGYEVNDFVDQLSHLINGANGKINVMLTLDSAPYSEMTEAKRLSLPVKHQKACDYINRFAPDNEGVYRNVIETLCIALDAKKLMPYISFQTSQEPDSEKYFPGTFQQFVNLTFLKYDVLKRFGRPIYIGDFTSRKLNISYRDFVNNSTAFDLPNVHYSTSLYPEVKGLQSLEWSFNYPKRNLPGAAITAYSIGTSTNENRINSPMYMVRAVQMLQWAATKQIDKIYFWKLVECNNESGDRMYASQTHLTGGGWKTNPVWAMQLQLIDICKGGYEVTSKGIIGKSGKEIQITETDYVVH